jgi:hypothetical protein
LYLTWQWMNHGFLKYHLHFCELDYQK